MFTVLFICAVSGEHTGRLCFTASSIEDAERQGYAACRYGETVGAVCS
jgi:hypothetical protein